MTRADNRKGQGVWYRERREEQWETRRRQRGRKNTIERKQSRILERRIRGREGGRIYYRVEKGRKRKKVVKGRIRLGREGNKVFCLLRGSGTLLCKKVPCNPVGNQ